MSANIVDPDAAAADARRRLRDSSATLLAQAEGIRDSSATLLARARGWNLEKPSLSSATPSARLVALDAARVLATFGVMWTHVAEMQGHGGAWAALGRFGTSFYILAAVYLATRSALKRPDEPFGQSLRKRAQRLLVPFLLWSAIYATYYASIALPRGDTIANLTLWWGPFAGTARHLWFLPFAFTAGTIASLLAPKLIALPTRRLLLVGALSTATVYWFCYRVAFFALDRFWAIRWRLHRMDRWIEELPVMVLAIFATALYVRWQRRPSTDLVAGQVHPSPPPSSGSVLHTAPLIAPTSVWVGLLLVGAFVGLEVFYLHGHEFLKTVSKTEGRFIANAAGISLLGAFLALGARRWMSAIAPLGRLTYFAFLAHVLFLDVFNVFLTNVPGYGSLPGVLLSTVVLFAVSVLAGLLTRHVRLLRWLIP